MRVYVRVDRSALRRLHDTGWLGPAPLHGFAATPTLGPAYGSDDVEELEYAAMSLAARGGAGPVAVVAADAEVRLVDDPTGAVEVLDPIPRAAVASIHLGDDPDALAWYATQELPTLLGFDDLPPVADDRTTSGG